MKYLGLRYPGLQVLFERFVKPSGLASYVLNVRSLKADLVIMKKPVN